ncbi:MAG TPA: hypothetical protein VFY29_12130 [Terriglobia bacterium]|nr:hypothetical protein [Terriglobia bacterium]
MWRRRLTKAALVAALFLGFQVVPARAQGCSGCRAALEFSEEGRQMMASLESGILLLMGAPYIMVGAAGFAIVHAYRKRRAADADAAAASEDTTAPHDN